jgi:hypothetical protein
MSGLENFWGDWQHKSDDSRPAIVIASLIYTAHCGECGIQLDKSRLPSNCDRGHPNDRRTADWVPTWHCRTCGLQLKREGWPQTCAKGHRNQLPDS